jgi:hypothetical protein
MRKVQQGWEKHKREGQIFQEGDQVWLEGHHIKTHQPMAKLAAKRHSPFKIMRVLSPLNYQLELPAQWRIHDMFHVGLLTPYRETDFHGRNYEQPPPDLINGEEEYEIEHMVDSQCYGCGGKIQYLIKWKGYPDSENQWVSWDDVNAPELLAEFKERNPNALSHIRGTVGDENLTSLGFPPATVRSSLTPALHSFIWSALSTCLSLGLSNEHSKTLSSTSYQRSTKPTSNTTSSEISPCSINMSTLASAKSTTASSTTTSELMSNASDTSLPSYDNSITRVDSPSSARSADEENYTPLPIPPHTATPFSGESAICTALRIETPNNAQEYDAIFRVLRAMQADNEETGRPWALADISSRAIVLEEHTGRDRGVYSTTNFPADATHIRPPPHTETLPPLGFHCN